MLGLWNASSFQGSFWVKNLRNAQDIIPSILVFSANSLLSPFPPASGIRPGSESDLRMEDICKRLNIKVLHGSNMSFWILHPASVHSYQKHLAILSMLRRALTGRYALLRDRLVFVQVASQESPREHTAAKTEGIPPCTHMALKIFRAVPV